MDLLNLLVAGAFVLAGVTAYGVHVARRRARERRDAETLEEKRAKGAHLARSLHPVIDADVCIGSLSCLRACPEGDILGVVGGAARLVHGDHCIGHGRCAAECPVHAIKLVFGSAERGVDLPEVDEFFESSRAGVHVVGELGGMGLIKNAVTQGLQVAERLAVTVGGRGQVVVVGAGPAGISAAIGLKTRGVPFRLIEQDTVGGSVAHYPRRKIAMTDPVDLPGAGKIGKARISKEELLATWRRAMAKVVLAVGRRGTPRKLGVPGEQLEKVLYGLKEPEQFDGEDVLVVGGGDAALEAAMQLAEESSARVALSYRGAELGRCREANREKFGRLVAAGKIRALLPSVVKEVRERQVVLDAGGETVTLPNGFVIVNIGGDLPTEFLGKVGVAMRRYHGEAPGAAKALDRARRATGSLPRSMAARRSHGGTRALRLLYLVAGLATLAALAWIGRDYYPLSRTERLASGLHATLKPAGPFGHGVGIGATLFMLSNFLYAVRKRWKSLAALGKIGSWLDFHVFVGLMSPLVIAFHAAFQSNNQLATGTAASLAIVVTTGVIGRYIYGVVPADGGKALELSELLGHFERLKGTFGDLPRGAATAAKALVRRVTQPPKAGALVVLFLSLPVESILLRLRLLALRLRFEDRERFASFRVAVLELERLRWQIRFYASLKRLLRGWRAFHASLALLLVVAIAVHIGLSLYLGYGLLRR